MKALEIYLSRPQLRMFCHDGRCDVQYRIIPNVVLKFEDDRDFANAQTYLHGLLAKQEDEGVSIRIFVAQPGTPQAETCIAYCRRRGARRGYRRGVRDFERGLKAAANRIWRMRKWTIKKIKWVVS